MKCRFERAGHATVNVIRTDDALGAVQQGRVDVALIRGHLTSAAVRMVHLFAEARVAVRSVRCPRNHR